MGLVEIAGLFNLADRIGAVPVQCAREVRAEFGDGVRRERVQHAGLQRKNQRHLVGEPQRRVLGLIEDRTNARSARQPFPDARIRHAAEAREHLEFQELRIVEPQRVRGGSQRPRLRLAADAADARADVDGWFAPFVEEPGIQHDLTVGDRDQIGGNVGAEIAGVGLGDR